MEIQRQRDQFAIFEAAQATEDQPWHQLPDDSHWSGLPEYKGPIQRLKERVTGPPGKHRQASNPHQMGSGNLFEDQLGGMPPWMTEEHQRDIDYHNEPDHSCPQCESEHHLHDFGEQEMDQAVQQHLEMQHLGVATPGKPMPQDPLNLDYAYNKPGPPPGRLFEEYDSKDQEKAPAPAPVSKVLGMLSGPRIVVGTLNW